MPLTGEKLERLRLLLSLEPKKLTDDEITDLLENREELAGFTRISRGFPYTVEAVQRYRARRTDLSLKSTKDLEALLESILARRREDLGEDDSRDPMSSPVTNSSANLDERIIRELLEEREAASAVAT